MISREQEKINKAEPFTIDDIKEKNKLLDEGFGNWNRREFMQFIHGCAKYGSKNYLEISNDVKGKDENDVRLYSDVFWTRYKEVDGWERYLKEIESGEKKLERLKMQGEILHSKIKDSNIPIEDLTIMYPPNNSKRMYSLLEDRYLLIKADEYGLTNQYVYDLIKRDINKEEMFKYCFYFKSRTTNEISRRIATLLLAVSREVEGPDAFKRKRRAGKDIALSNGNKENNDEVEDISLETNGRVIESLGSELDESTPVSRQESILIMDDEEDEGPMNVTKKRKLEDISASVVV